MSLISERAFSKVYRVGSVLGFVIFVKKFKKNIDCICQGYNLKTLYQRNRTATSMWGYKFFYRNYVLRKYLPQWAFAVEKLNWLVTISKCSKTTNLTSSIKTNGAGIWIDTVEKLTLDMRKANFLVDKKVPDFINNQEVWKLKNELQIIKPLSFLIGRTRAKTLANSLGENNHIAHGDLQPKNIILEGDRIEIIDFEESFVAPKDWDEGFLWGNLLYQFANNRFLFKKIVRKWSKFSLSHKNYIIISVAICMMRVFLFPLYKYPPSTIDYLKKFCLLNIDKI